MKIIYTIIGMILLNLMTATASLCYQENFSESTACGALGGGNMTQQGAGAWWGLGIGEFVDGSWVSYTRGDTGTGLAVNITYVKPISANYSIWQIRGQNSTGVQTLNFTLNGLCFSQGGTIILKVDSGNSFSNWSCFNGSEQVSLLTLGYPHIYEEGMYWSIVPYLFLNFSEANNITITSTGNGMQFIMNKSINEIQENFGEGQVLVNFGNDQLFSYYNDLESHISEYLQVINTDLVQKIKVLESGTGVSDVLVKVYKQVNGEDLIVFSSFTDGNGQTIISIDDGNSYKITAEKEGYNTAQEIVYIPVSNTETILININSTMGGYVPTTFVTNCGRKESKLKNCTFTAEVYGELKENITIIVNENGTLTSKECLNVDECITNEYTISNTSNPINASLYVDGTLIEPIIIIEFEDLSTRTIQINFPVTAIRSDRKYTLLFYFITLIVGLFIAVSVEKKATGWGLLGFIGWMALIASTGFWEYWLIIVPLITIQVGKLYYKWIK